MVKGALKFEFRDVSSVFQKIREFILGGKYKFHNRFPSVISPRSIPRPEVHKGPELKYADRWFTKRHVLDAVKSPVIVPVAEGSLKGTGFPCVMKSDTVSNLIFIGF